MSKHRFIFCLAAFGFLCIRSAYAQYDEVGFMVGASRYKGELSPHLFDTKYVHPAVGFFYRHNWTRHWGWKVELNYGRISGSDETQPNYWDRARNLSFYSDILEVTPAIEFNFFEYEVGRGGYGFTPFLFTGITVLKFNPKAEYKGEDIELQPLGTEGQGLVGREDYYNRTVFAIPIGGGIKASLGSFGFALQVSARRTYTDYLDDVSTTYPNLALLAKQNGSLAAYFSDPALYNDSTIFPAIEGKQRGNSADKDWYVFATLNISVRLNSLWAEFCKPFKKRRYH